jgi:transcriptional regulator with XRE-family HTH domain
MEPVSTEVRVRIQKVLDDLGQSPAWLADRAGLERSTVWRILRGHRNPTAETLATLAPVLGLSLAELVRGTTLAARVEEAVNLVSRSHYEAAVKQVIEFERAANVAADQARAEQQIARLEEARRRDAEARVDALQREIADIKLTADRHERDAKRYSHALERALGDIARLKTEISELGASVQDGRKTGRVAAILAGAAAAASAATYFAAGAARRKNSTTSGTTNKGSS